MTTKQRLKPYWLEGDEAECPYCGHLYAYEVEVRCIDCDGPACPICAVFVHERRTFCRDCVPKENG